MKSTPISAHYRQMGNQERRADVTKIEKFPVENSGRITQRAVQDPEQW